MSEEDQNSLPESQFKQHMFQNVASLVNQNQYMNVVPKIKKNIQRLIARVNTKSKSVGNKKTPYPIETHIVIVGGDKAPGQSRALVSGAFIRAAINYLKTVNFSQHAHIVVITHSIPSAPVKAGSNNTASKKSKSNPSLVYLKHMQSLLKKKFGRRYFFYAKNFDQKKNKILPNQVTKQIKGVVRSVVMFSHGSFDPYIAYRKPRQLGEKELDVFKTMTFHKDAFALFVSCSCESYATDFFDKTGVPSIGIWKTWVYFKDWKRTKGWTAALGKGAKLYLSQKGGEIEITKKMTRLWYVKKNGKNEFRWSEHKLHAITLLQKLHKDGVQSLIGKNTVKPKK